MLETFLRRGGLIVLVALSATVALAAQRVNADRRGLAVQGYDVVAYFVDGRAVPGQAAFEHELGGVRYRFSKVGDEDLEILQMVSVEDDGQGESERINLEAHKEWMVGAEHLTKY